MRGGMYFCLEKLYRVLQRELAVWRTGKRVGVSDCWCVDQFVEGRCLVQRFPLKDGLLTVTGGGGIVDITLCFNLYI